MARHQPSIIIIIIIILLQGYKFPLLTKANVTGCHRIILEEEVVLPAKSEMVVNGKIVYAHLHG